MKKLVVTYSLTGNCRFIAEQISAVIGADLLELKPKKELKGAMALLVGGFQAVKKKKPEILPLDKNPQDYDLIVIGTPVWASTYVPALHTFLSNVELKGKKIALFCCYGGGAGHTFEDLKKLLTGNEILGELGLKMPLKKEKEENAKKAGAWGAEMLKKSLE